MSLRELCSNFNTMNEIFGGGGGIRTPGKLSLPTVFKTVAIDHSATPPRGKPDRLKHAM